MNEFDAWFPDHDGTGLGELVARTAPTPVETVVTRHADPDPRQEGVKVVLMADVKPEKVQWLWNPFIPLGKLTLLEGDPGVGKSWVTAAINVSGIYLPPNCPKRRSGGAFCRSDADLARSGLVSEVHQHWCDDRQRVELASVSCAGMHGVVLSQSRGRRV